MNLIFYDFEVFSKDWMVVFINQTTNEINLVINDPIKLNEFYEKHIDDIWVGYNSRNYDQFILKGILLGKNPFDVSNELIIGKKKGYQVLRNAKDYPLNNFDIATGFHSLKQLEGFMGSEIKESSVSFNIDRKLTKDEIKEVAKYCYHDVKETMKVFSYRKEEYDSQLALIKAFNLDMSMFTKTKAQLAAHILGALRTDRNDEFDLTLPDTLVIGDKYKHIVDWYKNPENMDYNKKLITEVAGVEHIFAWGGIHAAAPNYSTEGIILHPDVGSMYPSIMIEYGFVSRNVDNIDKYRQIRDTRLKLKAEKNPMQAPYKIVLNSTFGASKDKYNPLYDPLMANNICVAGQLLLLDLIEKLEPHCKLIQSNTDGLIIKIENEADIPKVKSMGKEWENRTRLTLDWGRFTKIYQKDVNNYIIVDEHGDYESKGSYLKKLSKIDYDLPIVNNALISYFVENKPIEDTINECDDLIEFQKIVKVTSLYKYAIHNDIKLDEKVIRVFASNRETDGSIFKIKDVIDKETEKLIERVEKIANTPDKCFMDMSNIVNKKVPSHLDKQYYIDISLKRLNDFLDDSKEKKHKVENEIKGVKDINKDAVMSIYESLSKDITFVDFVHKIKEETSIEPNELKTLITLNKFNRFGKNKKLLDVLNVFENFAHRKQIRFKDIELLGIDEDVLLKYCNKTTKSLYKELDMIGYVKEVTKYIEDKQLGIKEQIMFEIDKLGNAEYVIESQYDNWYIVLDLEYNEREGSAIIRQINSGNEEKVIFRVNSNFKPDKFKQYSVIKILKDKQVPKVLMVRGEKTKSDTLTERQILDYEVY